MDKGLSFVGWSINVPRPNPTQVLVNVVDHHLNKGIDGLVG